MDNPNPGSESEVQNFLNEEVAKARGVDAWDSISCEAEGERMRFQAVAYFPNLAALRLHCQGLHLNMFDFVTSQDGNGNLIVENKRETQETPTGKAGSDDELRAQIGEERAKFAQAREFIEGFFGGLTCTVTIRTPGRLVEAHGLKRLDDHSAQTRFEGDEVLKVLSRKMEDDDFVLQMIKNPVQGPDALQEMLGGVGPMRIVAGEAAEAAFPYSEEMGQALERFEELATRLGLARAPERTQPLDNARIVAAKVVRETDPERELSPQNESHPCVVLTVCGELPGCALKLEEATLEALADTSGNNWLPEDDWDRRIHFPKLTKDGKTAFFDITIKVDPSSLEGFSEIRGVIAALVAGTAEDVDLGFDALEAGAEGKEFGARIESVDTQTEDQTTLEIKLEIARERVQGMAVLTADGETIAMSPEGYSACNDECTLTYKIEGTLPGTVRVMAHVARTIQTHLVPFTIENVDLSGRPMVSSIS